MRDAVDEAISCGVLEDTMDDDQTCPESVLLVLMERAFRGPTHEGVRILDWQPQLKRVLQCMRENDPVYGVLRDDIERLRAENEALRKDAERYRWLRAERDSAIVFMHINGEPVWRDPRGDELDAAIDAARKGEGE